MSKHKKRHLSPAGFVLSLILLIAGIFAADAIIRLFRQPHAENIVGSGGFSLSPSSSAHSSASDDEAASNTASGSEESIDESGSDSIVLELTSADLTDGTLIAVDDSHPYAGSTAFTDFSSITNENVKPRLTSLPIRAEVTQPICDLFDDYAAANGSTNLQIYSTLQSTLESSGLYSNILADRDTGYSFDIGLITSTGEVVPYIQKHNEWMLANVWQYGFILRYPADKTDITGGTYAPHHFRYVGQPHAAIMYANNLCLEEYLSFLHSYTLETGGFTYVYQDTTYVIYYVPMDPSGVTTVELPKDTIYTVSGDNQTGFIITTTSGIDSNQTETSANEANTTDATNAETQSLT